MGRVLPALSRRTRFPPRRYPRAAGALRQEKPAAVIRRPRYRSQQCRRAESLHRSPIIPLVESSVARISLAVSGVYPILIGLLNAVRGRIFFGSMAHWLDNTGA